MFYMLSYSFYDCLSIVFLKMEGNHFFFSLKKLNKLFDFSKQWNNIWTAPAPSLKENMVILQEFQWSTLHFGPVWIFELSAFQLVHCLFDPTATQDAFVCVAAISTPAFLTPLCFYCLIVAWAFSWVSHARQTRFTKMLMHDHVWWMNDGWGFGTEMYTWATTGVQRKANVMQETARRTEHLTPEIILTNRIPALEVVWKNAVGSEVDTWSNGVAR